MIVATGNVALDIDLNQLNGTASGTQESKRDTLRFQVGPDSFFTIIVTNSNLRGPLPGSMGLIPQNSANLPAPFNASLHQLVLEKRQPDEPYDLVLRDSKCGFVFFNVEGHHYDYDTAAHLLSIKEGRLLISAEFAARLGRSADAGLIVGKISIVTTMYPIEIQTVVNGEVQAAKMPPRGGGTPNAPTSVPGPDVIVGDLPAMMQGGSSGGFVGLGVGTTSCNNGDQEFNWFALPNTDHPVIPQNLYRMSGGTGNDERFEQIGQSWLKHAFTALQGNACFFGCIAAANGTHLGVGCSDPYSVALNYDQSRLGSRAWVNPFTGFFPGGGSDPAFTSRDHTGHIHPGGTGGTSHRLTVAMIDLDPTLNVGATYWAEGQYVTPHEYAWCQAHPGQCNQYNNVSYRRFNITSANPTPNPTSFAFAPVGSTVRMQPAIQAWSGATINQIEPEAGVDGIGFVGCKVTNPSVGVWHYEYAVYNENLDRAIRSFSVPLGLGIGVSNIGFHAPPQEPAWAHDGTLGDAGFAGTPWQSTQDSSSLTWSSETFAENQNANAIRWGTLYNFRFDADSPPQAADATVGFFKTGAPITVGIQVPIPGTPTPAPSGTPTPTPTATPTPTPTLTPTPIPTSTPTPTPTPILVATVSLPAATIDTSVTDFTQPVVTSEINATDNLVRLQGDFTFDSSVITFQSPPVSSDGLTASNWNVTGNVVGAGTIKTLHVSASSNDLTPLSGSGTLFTLNMTRVGSTPGAVSPLVWQPDPDNFVFIDSALSIHGPGSTPPGSISVLAITISGTISYCSNSIPGPVPNVTLDLTGDTTASTLSNGSGNYQLLSLTSGGSYTVTPTKADRSPGSAGINVVDVIAAQGHFLNVAPLPPGCRLAAADVNGDNAINTVDVIAIDRFFLQQPFGTANVGKYQFTPASRTYPAVGSNQTAQNYDALIFGDVAPGFADRAGGPLQDTASDDTSTGEVAATVAAVTLPEVAVDQLRTPKNSREQVPSRGQAARNNFTAAVRTTAIDAKNKLVGFQGDFTFDERVVTFQSEPVQKAGITGGNWNVSGNVLPGAGPIRTLRVAAYSNDFTSLSGSGTLFELRMKRVSQAAPSTPLLWAAPPDQFIFIDADLKTQRPANAVSGRVTTSGKR